MGKKFGWVETNIFFKAHRKLSYTPNYAGHGNSKNAVEQMVKYHN